MTKTETPATGTLSRRSLTVGAAWAVPTVATIAAAPAFAASPDVPPNGLEGWVHVRVTDRTGNSQRVSIDGANDSSRYLRVTQTLSTQTITGVWIVFLVNRNIPDSAWSRTPGDDGNWSLPVQETSVVIGGQTFWLYRTTLLTTPITGVSGVTDVPNGMHFQTTDTVANGSLTLYARRYVDITPNLAGQTNPVWFQRGPVPLG